MTKQGCSFLFPCRAAMEHEGRTAEVQKTLSPTLQTLQFQYFSEQFSTCCFPSKCTLQKLLWFYPNQWVKCSSVTSVGTLGQKAGMIFTTMLKALEHALKEALCTALPLRERDQELLLLQ